MEEYILNNRRKFLKNSILATAGISTLSSFKLFSEKKQNDHFTKLTILHTNDMHSHIEPFSPDAPKMAGLGGMSARSAIIKRIRKEEKNVLLLDVGDVFQGTPYFNFFNGEPEFKLMSEMRYDACTLGNHDFDNGELGFLKVLPHANFPFLNVNYNFSDSPLNGNIEKFKIFEKENIKIGVFGLGIELQGLVDKKNYGKIIYENPLEKGTEYATLLKNQYGCDFVICLSHLGYEYNNKKVSDIVLAENTKNIDLILGGHTHTFLIEPVEKKNLDKKKVLINQVGWAGVKLGKIDFYFHKKKGKREYHASNVWIKNSSSV
jgi:5'-nucleotidase